MNETNGSVVKVFSVKDAGHHYYVQEMPGYCGVGRNYAVMKDRQQYYYGRFITKDQAKAWLLKRLLVEMGQRTLQRVVEIDKNTRKNH